MNKPLVPPFFFGAALLCASSLVLAQEASANPQVLETNQLATQLITQAANTQAQPGARIDVQVGQLDPRLRLAPCQQTQTYLLAGQRLIGNTRIGLRCLKGSTLWNVSLPVTVAVYAPAMVALNALPAGTRITAEHVALREIDWGSAHGGAFASAAALIGRELARPLSPGATVQASDLRQRQWFASGETVRVTALGAGFVVTTDGEALSPGLEGQSVRVRLEGGKVFTGRAVADRQIEVAL